MTPANIATRIASGTTKNVLMGEGGMYRQRATEVRVGVGPEGVERDVTQVEQSGESDDHVESDRQQAEDPDLLEDRLLPER